jgi:vacuolar-type H+-ATPase subunit H
MEEDLLQAVIKVEKEIQQSIEAEKKKAEVWLEAIRVSLSRELKEKKQQLLDDHDQSLEETCQITRHKAEKEISEVNQMAAYLQNLPEDVLLEVSKYLQLILPEEYR